MKKFLEVFLDWLEKFKKELENKEHYTELKLIKEILPDIFIEGTIDLLILEDDIAYIVDLKTTSSLSNYEDGSQREDNLQPLIYSRLVDNTFKPKEIYFKYIVFEKKSSTRIKEYKQKMEPNEEKILELVSEYLEQKQNPQPRPNKRCRACKISSQCPLYKINVNLNEDNLLWQTKESDTILSF